MANNMMKNGVPTKKLPYDIPVEICEALKLDAKKLDMPATQLLIKLIKDNHNNTN